MDNPGVREMTYNFYEIHLAHPGHEMQPFCHTAQLLSRILTVASLRAVQNERASIMALTLRGIWHDVQC
jgi:hypothetical protein